MEKIEHEGLKEFIEMWGKLLEKVRDTRELTTDDERMFVAVIKKLSAIELMVVYGSIQEANAIHDCYCNDPECPVRFVSKFVIETVSKEMKSRGGNVDVEDEAGPSNDDGKIDIAQLDLPKVTSTMAAGKVLNSLIWALALVAIVVIVAVAFG